MNRIDKLVGFLRQTWCVSPDYFEGTVQMVAMALASPRLADAVRVIAEQVRTVQPAAMARQRDGKRLASIYSVDLDGVARINIAGVIGKALTEDECKWYGMVDVDDVSAVLQMAVNDPAVKAIMLDIDSPGGTITGVPELADQIMAARGRKPIMAYTDTLMCSAAYWIGCQASALYASKTAAVGSIGVYIPILDISGLYEKLGLKADVISSGDLKAMGFPGTSLTEVQRQYLQDRVTETHGEFMEAVRNVRGNISEDNFRGQAMYAQHAKSGGLLDDLSDFETARRDALRLKRG